MADQSQDQEVPQQRPGQPTPDGRPSGQEGQGQQQQQSQPREDRGGQEQQQQPPQQAQQRRGDRRARPQGQPQQRQQQQRQRYPQRRPEGQPQREGGSEVSVVIPVYNEEQSLRELYDKLRSVLLRMRGYEILFVDDGSTDGSFRVMQEIRGRDRRVKIIRFRRNYGKSAALSVGFQHARSEFVVTMDSDLQDDPAEIPSLVNEIQKGFDLVSGWKKKRRDPISKKIPSRFFNFVTSLLTGIRLHDFNCGLKAYRRDVVKEIRVYGELHRYIPVLAHQHGYKITELPVQHHARKYGRTKFGIGRFWKGFLDLLTVLFTTRYFRRPLHLFGMWGLVCIIAGAAIDGYLVWLKFAEGMALSNRPLFVVGSFLIVVGVQFVSIGLLGEMVSKTRAGSEEEYAIREIWK